jgi:hypothetical protein
MMLKFYNSTPQEVLYWEAWSERGQLAVHEGKLGTKGKSRLVRPPKGMTLDLFLASLAEEQRKAGFAEIAHDDHHWIVVQYQLETWGSAKNLDKAVKVENLLNECLGWTGNGHCDGNEIGSGEMEVFAVVVDPKLGAETIIAELKKKPRLLAGAVVAIREGEDYRVVHPPGFQGEFRVQ